MSRQEEQLGELIGEIKETKELLREILKVLGDIQYGTDKLSGISIDVEELNKSVEDLKNRIK